MACRSYMPCPCHTDVPVMAFDVNCDTENELDDPSEIFNLIDQYHELYKQVLEEKSKDCVASSIHLEDTNLPDNTNENKSTAEIEIFIDPTTVITEPTAQAVHLDIENNTQKVPEKIEDKRPEKRVQFASDPDDDIVEVKSQPNQHETSETKPESDDNFICEDQLISVLDKIKDKRVRLKEKFQKKVDKQIILRSKIDFLKEKFGRFDQIMDYHHQLLAAKNDECSLLCTNIQDLLESIKEKQNQYKKSHRNFHSHMRKLHQKERQLRETEYNILHVRSLEWKKEITERNIELIESAIEKLELSTQKRKRLLNPLPTRRMSKNK
ncbi:uncharacterized protein LOC113469217 [Diaphorina citri]|uniref:Uncharacterized protein LOC113469217 n=1 Tax=Diaphorina citri TaxID=121845 RepID=A0A3Q0J294_DIACI|nr:uncharacterized protein LOC113469217 [Diaphorina citri]